MAPQEIRKFVIDEPFVPFRMHVSDGSSYEISHPSEIVVFPLHVLIALDPDDSGLYRTSVRVAPNHITRVEFLPDRKKLKA